MPKTIDGLLRTAQGAPCPGIVDFPDGLKNLEVTSVAHDSRHVGSGSLFFAIEGHASDGHNFAQTALEAGALAVVAQKSIDTLSADFSDKIIVVEDSRVALACAAANFFDNPSTKLKISGVTGTNGKTTTIYLLDAIARAAGEQSGVIGTVESKYSLPTQEHDGLAEECAHSSSITTPDALQLQALFAEMRDAKVDSVAMEVSSHAIDMHRVEQTSFAAVAFTNLSQDHLDYHNTMEEYRRVKERLFSDFDTDARVVNIDNQVGAELAARLKSEGVEVICVGMKEPSISGLSLDLTASEIVQGSHVTDFLLTAFSGQSRESSSVRVSFPLVGSYNVENALVAAGCAWARGISLGVIADGLSNAAQVPGRLEQIEEGQDFKVFVDYAHTPDALLTALAAVREQTTGRVIAVFGCGGDRDPSKRPLMGQAAAKESDHIVVTSDNPRSEDPASIVADVLEGVDTTQAQCDTIVDRRAAIFHAIAMAKAGDSILIAGKGHEDYQIFAEGTIHFDDREVARAALEAHKG